MIAGCPRCGAKYRVDPERLGPEGARLRCVKCEAVFRARAPEGSSAAVETAAQAAPTSESSQEESQAAQAALNAFPDADPERLVLIADPDAESAKQCDAALREWGLHPIVVHDGVEAMMTIQRRLPRAVILDAALPKMFGFQICEVMKRNDSLRDIGVVLVASVHRQERYRRQPTDLYGANAYVEKPDLPDALFQVLESLGLPLGDSAGSAPAVPSPAVQPEVAETPVVAAPPEAQPSVVPEPEIETQAADDGLSEERAKAERLARIIVSDIVLYNEEEFAAGVEQGDVVQRLDSAVQEGMVLFRQRVDERVRDENNYLVDELVRVARSRGME